MSETEHPRHVELELKLHAAKELLRMAKEDFVARQLVYKEELRIAHEETRAARAARDLAHEASNALLLQCREQKRLIVEGRTAVSFSSSAILSGESWTPTCDKMLRGFIDNVDLHILGLAR